ncbi:hypothetical protein QCA50_003550 [Cerrena zonata]|uniref:tRNA(Ile)-lysidine synthetase n=1 Tax=Cerrena zonata TaxID=2478898 RepID=A0AAW0GL68_9APHY
MANQASRLASQFCVPHVTTSIPWGVHPFPPKPTHGSMETMARRGRFNRLFDTMTTLQSSCLALGQHADDQVETTILRMGKGTGLLGASGMPFVRRWGMGGMNELDFNGYDGMRRYMIRPFLEIPKDRILATCEANHLDYVIDKTNFQPEVALRNQIRNILTEQSKSPIPGGERRNEVPKPVLPGTAQFQRAIEHLGRGALETKGYAALYAPMKTLQDNAQALSIQVTDILRRSILHSPPSTALIPMVALHQITAPEVRIALTRRLIRYLSPYPWGHLAAEVKGRRIAYEQLVEKVWAGAKDDPYHSWSFGSYVLWSPVTITSKGFVRYRRPDPGERMAWFLSREPPRSQEQRGQKERMNPLVLDVTPTLKSQLKQERVARILYDCRFLITFHLNRMPKWLQEEFDDQTKEPRIIIRNSSKFFLPQVILKRTGFDDLVLLTAKWDDRQPGFQSFLWACAERVRWIDATFVRPYSHV